MPPYRATISNDSIGPEKLTPSIRLHRYFIETFMTEPFCTVKGALAAPGGTSGTENLVHTGRYTFEYYFVGGASDGFYPIIGTAGGYRWELDDDTVAEGVEINFGGLLAGHARTYVPTSEDCFFRALLIFEDASGIDAFVGFRRVAAYAQTLTEYSDVVGIRLLGDSSSTTAAVSLITNLNNAGATDYTATATTLTLEDAVAVELEVRIKGARASFFVNGAEVVQQLAYTVDSGDSLAPVIRLLQTTDFSGTAKTLAVEGGLMADRNPATLLSIAGTTV